MKISIAIIVLGAVAIAGPPGFGQAAKNVAQAVDEVFPLTSLERATAGVFPNSLSANLVSHASGSFTVENAIEAINKAWQQQGDFMGAEILDQPAFQKLLKNQQDAIQLFDHFDIKFSHVPHRPLFLQELEPFAFNRGFDKHFTSVEQIMRHRMDRPEVVHYMINSPPFEAVTQDLNKLSQVVYAMEKDIHENFRIWDDYWPALKEKLSNLLVKEAQNIPDVSRNPDFLRFIQNDGDARYLFAKLREPGMKTPSTVFHLVENHAFGKTLHNFERITNFDQLVDYLKFFRDNNALYLLKSSPNLNYVITDPFNAYRLEAKLVGHLHQQDFFDILRAASNERYNRPEDVLTTFYNLQGADARTFSQFKTFKPYTDFISNAEDAKYLLDTVDQMPQQFSSFIENVPVYQSLKAAAYKNFFPKINAADAGEVALSYFKLKQAGLESTFMESEGYLNFMRKGPDQSIVLVEAMKKLGLSDKDITFRNIEIEAIRPALLKLAHKSKKVLLAKPFIEELLLTRDGAQKVNAVMHQMDGQETLADYIKAVNPKFLAHLEDATRRASV